MTDPNAPSPMEPPDALVRRLAREVTERAEGRVDLAGFAAWLRTRLDILAEQLTSPHRSRPGVTKAARREDRTLN